MSDVLCLRCGQFKASVWRACPQCGYQPANDRELARSFLASSWCCPSKEKLQALAAQVQQGEPLFFDPAHIEWVEQWLAQRAPFDAEEKLQRIREAFAHEPRPEHFTNYTHCEECAEHDETLRAHHPDTIAEEHVGHAGWDPICFITEAGFRYYGGAEE